MCRIRFNRISLLVGDMVNSLPMCGFVAQLVEHRIGIAEVTGSFPVEALFFFHASFLHSDISEHSSLS